jgi:phosphopantothenoylcysteine decarboxylase/phosphopantothenate--cysteine ligase
MSEILLGVGGGIAAYKSCDLLRRLQDQGFEVTVIPTPASLNFVGKATWEALSGKSVYTQVWESVEKVNHVSLGDKAEYIIVAPATADLIARIANGRADDLLTNTILASTAPKLLVPAMHPKMWLNPATQANVSKLREMGFVILEPATGRLTGNDSGVGRFPDTSTIIEKFTNEILVKPDLVRKRILITAGGTREAIDDVRFISNRSSGNQGLALATLAQARGAEVTLISVNIANEKLQKLHGIKVVQVENTEELQGALIDEFSKCDVLIMAAAVSDAKPTPQAGKVKKDKYLDLKLMPTPDLLAEISKSKSRQLMVGFAAEESANLLSEGQRKLAQKNLDLIYANDISEGSIFGSDRTSGLLIDKDLVTEITPMSKEQLANRLLDLVAQRLNSSNV